MKIGKLDHVNIRTTQIDVMINWYSHVLGMHQGFRPASRNQGAWMYAGHDPAVHLVKVAGNGAGSETALKLEHFAFSATGFAEFEARLQAMNERYERFDQPEVNLIQVNVWDPDGNHIHVDFPLDE